MRKNKRKVLPILYGGKTEAERFNAAKIIQQNMRDDVDLFLLNKMNKLDHFDKTGKLDGFDQSELYYIWAVMSMHGDKISYVGFNTNQDLTVYKAPQAGIQTIKVTFYDVVKYMN